MSGDWGWTGQGDRALEFPEDGEQVAVSPAGRARLRYNDVTNELQLSLNGAPYVPIGTGAAAGGWTDDGGVVRLTTAADDVAIGAAAMSGDGEKVRIVGNLLISDTGSAVLFDPGPVVPAQVVPKRQPTDGSGLVGRSMFVRAAIGANADAGTPGAAGGVLVLQGARGGDGSATMAGGVGGAASLAGGAGGVDGGGGGDAGGAVTVTGGAATAGDGGDVSITGGAPAGGIGGDVNIEAGTGGGTDGVVNVGTVLSSSVNIGSVGGALGFHGGGPATQGTVVGAKGGNAALASLLGILAANGLVIDGSGP